MKIVLIILPIRLQDSLKKLRDQVHFWFADKQSFLQIAAINFGDCGQACPK